MSVELAAATVGLRLAEGDGDLYQVTAMDAGSGNGWEFSPAVLAASTHLWQRVNVYLGHARDDERGPNGERQPPQLCGVFSGGYFDTDGAAIRGRLRLVGPAAAMARSVARAYLDAYGSGEVAPDVGLSASLFLVAVGNRVEEITRVESLDVIATTPARGGRFEAALSAMEDQAMAHAVKVALSQAQSDSPLAVGAPSGADALPAQDSHAVGTAAVQPIAGDLAAQVAAAVAAALGSMQNDIASLRTGLAAQVAPAVIQNLGAASDNGRRDGRITPGQAPLDQLQTAVDAMFGVRLPQGAAFSRLRGIKDLFCLS